jgi:hypothetical protein
MALFSAEIVETLCLVTHVFRRHFNNSNHTVDYV